MSDQMSPPYPHRESLATPTLLQAHILHPARGSHGGCASHHTQMHTYLRLLAGHVGTVQHSVAPRRGALRLVVQPVLPLHLEGGRELDRGLCAGKRRAGSAGERCRLRQGSRHSGELHRLARQVVEGKYRNCSADWSHLCESQERALGCHLLVQLVSLQQLLVLAHVDLAKREGGRGEDTRVNWK